MARRPLVVGNWKMHGLQADLDQVAQIAAGQAALNGQAEVAVAPPFTLLMAAAQTAAPGLALAGQDCSAEAPGAHTGDIAAAMLADLGAAYVILGHSERRQDHGESDGLIRAKMQAAFDAGLRPILCVGESLEDREAGRQDQVVARQLEHSCPANWPAEPIIAYEPVWAIGTGRTAEAEDIAAMHAAIRDRFDEPVRILYGGSVKPQTVAPIAALSEVDGALVGGASLKAEDFLAIAQAFAQR
ncbi:MAG: triose-phosphate isomerase [Rhodothalassiaceae bacterium]